jgi:putative transposase
MFYKDPLQPGCTYHIYNRGNNKENIFKDPENYPYFLSRWKKYIPSVADTHCYCLLPNHFHFLIHTKDDVTEKSIKQALSNCFNSYSKSINSRYGRTGSLFQERFGRKIIETDRYFTNIIFYVHSNPQKHRLIKDFRNYPHSSYQSLLSNGATLLTRDYVLNWFGGKEQFEKFHDGNQQLQADYLRQLEI